jgi:ADP-heptose:LPS heptosyltransferase/GT2 family glycosyltransferase
MNTVMSLFGIYGALAGSGLFDANYYLATNPEIAATHLDPLVHYIEEGARRGLRPHPAFDVSYYLEQCALSGEHPENPLFHYLTVGAARGLQREREQPKPDADSDADCKLFVDAPQRSDGAVPTPIRGSLLIAGWALARAGVASLDVEIDGMRLLSAHHAIPRPDVQKAFPDWDDALHSGFAASIPHRSLPPGRHGVGVVLRDKAGKQAKIEFRIEVEGVADGTGPGSLRRKMTQAEIDLDRRVLAALDWDPVFCLPLVSGGDARSIARLHVTLRSLRAQAYGQWRAVIVARDGRKSDLRERALDGFDDLADRVTLATQPRKSPLARLAQDVVDRRRPILVSVLRAGDELGCDALMQFALASGMHRDADLLYADDWRPGPHGTAAPFLKPDWSPDLLLSTNYIGRWCASADLLDRAGVSVETLLRDGDYDAVLRCSEQARSIHHVQAVISQPDPAEGDGAAGARRALEAALARRGIAGEVVAGKVPGRWRVRRALAAPEKVSIIIPTRAARGLIRTCIETLRSLTAYRKYEIVAIDDIPDAAADWKAWLAQAADRVIAAEGSFNWSRYNNRAAAQCRGRYLLFLNDDIEIIDPSWLEGLLEHAQRTEVGAVGPMLLYPDRTIQHAGMFLAAPGTARHAFRFLPEHDSGYFGLAQLQRNVIAVTGACLLTRREVFERAGGFEERHDIVNGDLDYCLRLWAQGLSNVYTPHVRLIHHERASRSSLAEAYDADAFAERWRGAFLAGDPFFHPGLSIASDDVLPEPEPARTILSGHPIFAREDIRRILAVKLDHIGDCITALPALRRLKRHFPTARLSVLAGPWAKDVWPMEPAIDEVIEFEFYHARSSLGIREVSQAALGELRRRLAPHRFDLAVDLRKAPDTRTILQQTGARQLAGFDYGGRFAWLDVALEWDADPQLVAKRQHVGDDLINLVDAIATAAEPDRRAIARQPSAPLRLPARIKDRLFAKPVVCVHPGAGNAMRQWPASHFADLIDLLIERQGVNVVLIGGPDEQAIGRAVLEASARRESVFSLIGTLKLADLPSLLVQCVLFIGNNSGPKHLAAGLGVPTVAVHSGVVDGVEWGPMGPSAVAVQREMTCAPCYLERPEDCARHLACLTGLAAGGVYRVCEKLLSVGLPRAAGQRRRRPPVRKLKRQLTAAL